MTTTAPATYSGFIGRTADGDRVFLRIELRTRTGAAQTTWHEPVAEWTELSMTVYVYQAGRALTGDIVAGGQAREELLRVADEGEPADELPDEAIRELYALWNRWHLNGMRAGCAHQSSPWDRGGSRVDSRPLADRHVPDCPAVVLSDMPVTAEDYRPAYRYGSAWLVEIIPADVLARLHELGAAIAAVDEDQAEDEITTVPYREAEDQYEEWITGGWGEVEVAGMTFDAGRIVRELDPIAFRCGMNDWAAQEGIEIGGHDPD